MQDLLAAFLETPEGQDVDLSKVGENSGKTIEEIFIKAGGSVEEQQGNRQANLCGNGVINLGEECDGINLAGITECKTLNLGSGAVTCSLDCTRDTSQCSGITTQPQCPSGQVCLWMDPDGPNGPLTAATGTVKSKLLETNSAGAQPGGASLGVAPFEGSAPLYALGSEMIAYLSWTNPTQCTSCCKLTEYIASIQGSSPITFTFSELPSNGIATAVIPAAIGTGATHGGPWIIRHHDIHVGQNTDFTVECDGQVSNKVTATFDEINAHLIPFDIVRFDKNSIRAPVKVDLKAATSRGVYTDGPGNPIDCIVADQGGPPQTVCHFIVFWGAINSQICATDIAPNGACGAGSFNCIGGLPLAGEHGAPWSINLPAGALGHGTLTGYDSFEGKGGYSQTNGVLVKCTNAQSQASEKVTFNP